MTTVASPPNVPPSVAPPRPVATRGPEPKPAETGAWVAIATISMSFAALTSAMVVRASAAPDWQHFRLPPILYLNTLVLLASSFTLASARRRITPASAVDGLPGLYVTLGLGLLFVTGQILAWRQLAAQGLFLATSPSSAFLRLHRPAWAPCAGWPRGVAVRAAANPSGRSCAHDRARCGHAVL